MASVENLKFNGNDIYHSEFKRTADKISGLSSKYGLTIKGYHHESLPHFSKLSLEKQKKVLAFLNQYYESMIWTEAHGDSLDNQQKVLWGFLSTFNALPNSEMFHRFKPDDVIEIYDLEGFQVWRNLNFMKICSYTLEEIYSTDWPERYYREPTIMNECTKKVTELLTEQSPEIYDISISPHVLSEVSSEQKFNLLAQHDWLGRIRDRSGKLKMWIGVSKVKIISKAMETLTQPHNQLHDQPYRPQHLELAYSRNE